MPSSPAEIWKALPTDVRTAAAEAFWRDDESPEIEAQHVEAIVMLAKRLNFRMKSLQALPVDRRAKHLGQVPDVSDGIATRALIAFHFAARRPLMGAFLDALGIAHKDGLITAEQVAAPERAKLVAATDSLKGRFPDADVALYLRTLSALDGETWGQLDGVGPVTS